MPLSVCKEVLICLGNVFNSNHRDSRACMHKVFWMCTREILFQANS